MADANENTKKTKKQIEAEVPFIKPEECPGKLIQYFNKKRKADNLALREIIREELEPVHKFALMASGNRIWLVILSAVMVVFGLVLIIVGQN